MTFIYKTGRDELYKQIKRYAKVIKGRVLDIGAGSYPRYQDLFHCDEYIKMDVESRKGIEVVGKIEKIPFEKETFDSVICTQVLGDVFDLKKAFEEIYRVLKPEGVVLITESLFDPLHDEPNDYWRFTEHSLKRLAINAKFKVETLEKRGGYQSVMAQLKTRYWIERLSANEKWFARLLSLASKILGGWALILDRRDKSRANQLFTHGYILIARKYV